MGDTEFGAGRVAGAAALAVAVLRFEGRLTRLAAEVLAGLTDEARIRDYLLGCLSGATDQELMAAGLGAGWRDLGSVGGVLEAFDAGRIGIGATLRLLGIGTADELDATLAAAGLRPLAPDERRHQEFSMDGDHGLREHVGSVRRRQVDAALARAAGSGAIVGPDLSAALEAYARAEASGASVAAFLRRHGPAVVEVAPDAAGGGPRLRGARVPPACLFEHLADGLSLREVLSLFPALDPEDCVTALHQACALLEVRSFREATVGIGGMPAQEVRRDGDPSRA